MVDGSVRPSRIFWKHRPRSITVSGSFWNYPTQSTLIEKISNAVNRNLTSLYLECSSEWSQVWSMLHAKTQNRVHLAEITTRVVTPELFAYLASYSGVQKLRLVPDDANRDASDRLADTFHDTTLPITPHSDSKKEEPIVGLSTQAEIGQSDIDPVSLLQAVATLPALRTLAILTVTLADPIEPFDFKVWNTLLFPQGSSLAFLTTLRIIDTGLNRTVTMFWKKRTGTFCTPAGRSVPSFQVMTTSASFLATLKGVTAFKLHSFNAAFGLNASISHFWFEVSDNDDFAPFIVDNNGANYTIDQDVLFFDPRCSSVTTGGQGSFHMYQRHGVNTTVPVTSSVIATFKFDSTNRPADGYTFCTYGYAIHSRSPFCFKYIMGRSVVQEASDASGPAF
ncbi:hypothetical protein B0H19DRAFT_1256791 [Mycena capillaripes]|nr:hypothetical protein B0H19DRAFT_1256791 [Mycena capillaripes]